MPVHESQRFHNRTLDLDGQAYLRCHFINCQFRFRGSAPFGFEDNRYEGAFWLHLLDDWRAMEYALDPLRRELRRYGADLDEALHPPSPQPRMDWSPAVMPGQREMHIEYWFWREKNPGGGLRRIEPEDESAKVDQGPG